MLRNAAVVAGKVKVSYLAGAVLGGDVLRRGGANTMEGMVLPMQRACVRGVIFGPAFTIQ